MKLILKILTLLLLTSNCYCQYAFLYRQYVLNGLGLNPAYSGSREVFTTSVLYRNQWTGIEGAPVTGTISADTPLKKNRIALGLYLISEKIANTNNTNIEINYAYRIPLKYGKLSLGLKTALNTFSVDELNINDNNDMAFNDIEGTQFLPNFGIGAYYYIYNKFFIGASVPSLLSYKTGSANNGYKLDHDFKYYNFLLSSGILLTYNDFLKFRLSGLTQYNIVSNFAFDINLMFILDDKFWIGGSGYTPGVIAVMAQYQINPQLKVGYTYDFNLGKINQAGASHEILLRYEFSYKIDAFNPRYF